MAVKFNKTKEMVMGPPYLTSNLPLMHTTTGHIERVNSTKLLGLYYIWTLILPGTHTHMHVCVTHWQRVVDHNPNMSQCAHV